MLEDPLANIQEVFKILLVATFFTGLSYITLGYFRRYRKKPLCIYHQFKDDITKENYLRLRGSFDILSGLLFIGAGLFYYIIKPNVFIFMGIFSTIIISVTITLYLIAKKLNLPY